MHTKTLSINGIALLSAIALGTAVPVSASTTFFSYSSTTYVGGGSEKLAGHDPTHVLGGSDQYGDPDGWSGGLPTTQVGRAFSSSTAFSPSIGVYSGPTFFGGGLVTSTSAIGNEGFHQLGVQGGGGGDAIHWYTDSNGINTHSAHLLVYFKKDQFTSPWGGLTPITTTSMANASFDVHTGQLSQSGPNDTRLYWVVQDGNDFWVAQNYQSIIQNAAFSTNFSAITGWAPYNPTVNLADLDFNEGSAFGAHIFSDIQGFGFYIEHEDGSTSSHGEIDLFVVNVPEPSRAVLALGGLGLSLLRRRRSRA